MSATSLLTSGEASPAHSTGTFCGQSPHDSRNAKQHAMVVEPENFFLHCFED